ncbi:transesterase-like protein [Mycena amicta]|nr:transesterase-like protein [Mycena amicta]
MVTLSQHQKNAIREIMRRSVSGGSLPPLFLGVTDSNGEIFVESTASDVQSLNADSVFWICSQTKLVTSIAALQLIEQGKIQLNTPVSEILPELAPRGSSSEITLGQLLNHTSGLDYKTSGPAYGSRAFKSY